MTKRPETCNCDESIALKKQLGEMCTLSQLAYEMLFYTFTHDNDCECPICKIMDKMNNQAAAILKDLEQ